MFRSPSFDFHKMQNREKVCLKPNMLAKLASLTMFFMISVFSPLPSLASISWTQVNADGFGDINNEETGGMAVYNDRLFVGTVKGRFTGTAAEVWRCNLCDGSDWTQVNTDGFGDIDNGAASSMTVYNNRLYVGTGHRLGGEVWRCNLCDGSDWTQVSAGGFGDANNRGTLSMAEYNSRLYVGTVNDVTGTEVWRCEICDGSDWAQVNTDGFGDLENTDSLSMAVYNSRFYVGTENDAKGAEVWRCEICDGSDWTPVSTGGFGDANNVDNDAMAVYNSRLYVGATKDSGGAEVWRCDVCDGSGWTQVNTDGFGDVNNEDASSMAVYNNRLYVAVGNFTTTGVEVWRCDRCDGSDWTQVNADGFGDVNNVDADRMAVYNNRLYAGTINDFTGTEVWRSSFEGDLDGDGDLDADGDVDTDDLNILLADRNQSVEDSACGEPCDLDGDGLITGLDARKLTLLCTRPRCATAE